MNNRAVGHHIQDFQFATDMPCRLEIFDVDDTDGTIVDPGRLLAIDAEGDGYFSSPADALLSDHSADGTSDIIIGRDSRCLEIHVWPLVRLAAGQSITLRSSLRTADGSWAPSAINEIKDR